MGDTVRAAVGQALVFGSRFIPVPAVSTALFIAGNILVLSAAAGQLADDNAGIKANVASTQVPKRVVYGRAHPGWRLG